MPQYLSAQIVCRSPQLWDFDEKKMLHCASVVRVNDLVPLFLILDASPIGADTLESIAF